jgi:hypothetical protein
MADLTDPDLLGLFCLENLPSLIAVPKALSILCIFGVW